MSSPYQAALQLMGEMPFLSQPYAGRECSVSSYLLFFPFLTIFLSHQHYLRMLGLGLGFEGWGFFSCSLVSELLAACKK